MNSRLLALLVSITLISSCTSIEEPTLERVEDVEILTLNKSKVEINASMILKNPNSFALDLDKAELVAMLDDVEVANIDQTYETEMPARSEFKMPVYINMDLDKLYNDNPLQALAKGLEIMSDRKLDVKFQGTIKVGKGVAKVSVDVDQLETVEF
jgi:LEA14-like dessication related protein